jgi:hypothetical protein
MDSAGGLREYFCCHVGGESKRNITNQELNYYNNAHGEKPMNNPNGQSYGLTPLTISITTPPNFYNTVNTPNVYLH